MTTPLLVLLVAAAVAASTASHDTVDHNTARTQLLIVGPTRLDGYQRRIVAQLVPQYEEITRHAAARDLTLLERGVDLAAVSDEDSHVLRRLPLPLSNYSEVLIASLGADEMSLTHIDILYQHIKTDRPLMVVEIGEPTVQLRALLKKGTACWGRSALSDNLSTHSVYLCNDVNPANTPAIATHSIVAFDGPVKTIEKSFTGSIWPCMFASAAKSKKRVVESESEEEEEIIVNDDKSTEKDDDDDESNNSKEDDDDDDKKKVRNIKEEKKLTCKYRKSCYETGKLPKITVAPPVKVYEQKDDSNETDDDNDDEEDITEQKLDCKYRKSCYKERGVPQTKKDEEREAHWVLSHREVPHVGKQKTLKEIAEKTVSKVHKKEKAAAKRPLPASIIVENKFEAMEEEMHKKLSCKYRKSCYESGDLPEIEESSFVLPSLPLFSSFSSDDDNEKKQDVAFEDMEEEQKKFYCKYRKSCYETGQLPEIESQLDTITLRNIGNLREVPTRVVSLQERCKYRKSCYETGELPDLSVPIEKFEETAKIKEEVPTSMDALKVFCKYRKSCYEHIAEEGSVDTVKKIRKQRTVQKELQRRLRREQHRQLRDQWRLKTSDEEDEEKISRTIKDKTKKKGTGKAAMVLETVATKVIEKAASKHKNKLDKNFESNEDDDIPVAVKVAVNKATRDNDINEDDNEGDDKDESKEENKKIKADSDEKDDDSEEEKVVVVAKHAHKKQGRKNIKKTPKNIKDDDHNSEKKDDDSDEDAKDKEKDKSDEDKSEERDEEKETKKSAKKSKAAAAAARLAAEMAAEEVLHRATKKKGNKAQAKDDSDSEEEHVKKHVGNQNVQKEDDDSAEEDAKEVAHKKIVAHKHTKKTKKDDDDSDEDDKEATTSMHRKKSEDSEEDNDDDEELTQKKKEFCKYRKSCYKSGNKPVIDEHYHSFHNTYNKEDDEEDDEKRKIVSHAHSEEERKLECKYRKSCYETGVLPVIRHLSPHQTPTSPAMGMTMELKCKYRKSCYAAEGYEKDSDDDAHVVEKEEKRKPIKEITEEPRVEKKRVEVAREQTKQHRDKEIKMEKKVDAAAKAADEDADDDRLDVENKLSCKYRKSCYSSLPKETSEDHAGNMARQHVRPAAAAAGGAGALPYREKCNEYYLSCREKLGLPPKEKAPIGPNGRRLCRKRKPE